MTGSALTLVVVAYHRPDALDRLLAAATDPAVATVVVVVDEDPAVAEVARRRGAVVVPLPGNPGYAAAVNRGVAAATTEVVVFCNDDLVVDAPTLLALADVVRSGAVAVAAPVLVDADGVAARPVSPLPTIGALALEWMLLPDRPVRGLGRLPVQKWRTPTAPSVVPAVMAAIIAVRTEMVRALPLPEEYFLYWEESEWFHRLHRAGCRVEVRPELQARHAGGRDDVRPDKSRLLARNAVRCVRRTQGRAAAAVAVPIVVAWNARLVAADGVRHARRRDERSGAVLRARWAGLVAACGSVREVLA
jgi:N-acetylglucosaminyl-diphospho-decaprenol L-rhamnosyltransferase